MMATLCRGAATSAAGQDARLYGRPEGPPLPKTLRRIHWGCAAQGCCMS